MASVFATVTFIFKIILLGQVTKSTWASLLIWVVRIATVSFLFRTFVGPSVLKLVSNRLTVRSISLRSIRGIYFRAGSGTWRIDRIGLSYHRPSAESSNRFSIKVEGLQLEVSKTAEETPPKSPLAEGTRNKLAQLAPLARYASDFLRSLYEIAYDYLEPRVRPVLRSAIVSLLRFAIRALPALLQALDFELGPATITFAGIPGVQFIIQKAKLQANVDLIHLASTSIPDPIPEKPTHRRFGSVTAWNARLASSLRRTWDRAWGSLEVGASMSLEIEEVLGIAQKELLKTMPVLPAKCSNQYSFLIVPSINFSTRARLDPHVGIKEHSLDLSLGVDNIIVDTDILRHVLQLLQIERAKAEAARERQAAARRTRSGSLFSQPVASAWTAASGTGKTPLMGVIAASIRFRRNVKQSAIRRLKTQAVASRLASLRDVRLTIAQFTLKNRIVLPHRRHAEEFNATFSSISLHAAISRPETNPLHKAYLGRSSAQDDKLSGTVYTIGFSMKQLFVERTSFGTVSDHLRVLSVGPLVVDALISQWPAPWIQGPTFLSGDPNAQLLVVKITLVDIDVRERVEIIHLLLEAKAKGAPSAVVKNPSLLLNTVSPVPRLDFGLQVGNISARVISPNAGQESTPFALEAHTAGFILTAQTHFSIMRDRAVNKFLGPSGLARVQMKCNVSALLRRTFIHVCVGDGTDHYPPGSKYPGEPILSLDDVQLTADGVVHGEMIENTGTVIVMEVPSAMFNVQTSVDAILVELWQPDAVSALGTVLKRMSSVRKPRHVTFKAKQPILDSLPTGLSASFAIARITVFVTGKDLAPEEDLNIYRGVAIHTGFSISYCSLRNSHVRRLQNPYGQRQRRLQLSLPSELITKAHTSALMASQNIASFMQVISWNFGIRDALSTQHFPDDPDYEPEPHDINLPKAHLKIKRTVADIVFSGARQNGQARPGVQDSCLIAVSVPDVVASFHLANVYNLLLALGTLKSISPPSKATASPELKSVQSHATTLNVDLSWKIDRLQLLWEFPLKSKLYARVMSLSGQMSPNKIISVGFKNMVLATSLDTTFDGSPRVEWEEISRFVDWRIDIQPDQKPLAVTIDAESARLRIPFEFVLADFILDINVTIKCIKHLVRMVPTGRFSQPLTPEAEEAKNMPNLILRVACLTVEIADEKIESRLALIWRAGFEATRLRLERDEAFEAKAATILQAEKRDGSGSPENVDSDFQFTSEHTISIAEARDRLNQLHAGAWKSRFRQAHVQEARREHILSGKSFGKVTMGQVTGDIVEVNNPQPVPPMFRMRFDELSFRLSQPSFTKDELSEFLFVQGNGLPRDSEFSLLIPMHLNFTVSALRMAYREYPLPLLNIPRHSQPGFPSFEFDSDIVIAEEMGTANSVEWVECAIVKPNTGVYGASPLYVTAPKTIMPVKSYANPVIRVTSNNVTDFGWGVSYGPITQDFMRVIDTLSHAPKDSSPAIGFWDKLRLIFHWQMQVLFAHEVHLHMKGSLNPYELRGSGTGFALCWKGNPRLLINQQNDQNEIVQMISDSMLIAVPNIEEPFGENSTMGQYGMGGSPGKNEYTLPHKSRDFKKVCAKFTSGVRFGVGIVLERSCGPECPDCSGRAFERRCRLFTFKPHYQVMLERKVGKPPLKSSDDSYNGFRSDFIHLSISLISSINQTGNQGFSSIHLSPKLFAHFWSWWTLFDGKSPPIRQGRRYKHKRPISPKFGQHLATIKYLISVERLFITHAYMDDSQDAWTDGVTPFVGVKALIGHFHADMHQRTQESTTITPDGATKTVVHKPFYSMEVVMKNLELRAMLAVFSDTLKQCVPLESIPVGSTYRSRDNLPVVDPGSPWIDVDDFVELDWSADGIPILHLLPVVSCPRFTYFRRAGDNEPISENKVESSKFGGEDTHVCMVGKEASVSQVQIELATNRINDLKNSMDQATLEACIDTERMISLLEDYVIHLRKVEEASRLSTEGKRQSYYMPSDIVSPEEWAAFTNVYQVHCPQIFMDNSIRDIMMQYYYCSRSRRGIEYHMATRAVKFIRDQAKSIVTTSQEDDAAKHTRSPVLSAQAAAQVVRKILSGDLSSTASDEDLKNPEFDPKDLVDPMSGWSEGVALQKSHFCLLLKPQIVLRSEGSSDSVCILAAVQGKLQTYNIMDEANAEDPVSGKVMGRNYASLTGMQTFSPSSVNKSGEGCVPLEVLVDLRCENSMFDRLVPQTDAILHYDKFNRLRLQNSVSSVARTAESSDPLHNHLRNQTDLLRVHIPRFTVTASDRHFQAISYIVTDLLLVSDAALKTRSDRLEKMLFNYDFTNLSSAADVVASLQERLRHAVEMRKEADWKLEEYGDEGEVEKLRIDAHIHLLAEELDLVFEAIKMAQNKADDNQGQKSALLLHASSSEISWRMLDHQAQLIAKLAVRDIDFYWLNRQDSSTVNHLAVGDLQAFDGSADAEWPEILTKYDEKSNHPLIKQKLFLLADWTVLPPVGGITIYEAFELMLHPMRLQVDSRVGKKIMEYVWPARRNRKKNDPSPSSPVSPESDGSPLADSPSAPSIRTPTRASTDMFPRKSLDSNRLTAPALRRLGPSRSFTDLRNVRMDSLNTVPIVPRMHKTRSSDGLFALAAASSSSATDSKSSDDSKDRMQIARREKDDATEMKTRSSQKTFVLVRIASLHLLLSISQGDFLCRDARIKTRDLEYRNQTWSFEELVDQFIPSGKSWKGWVKMAFQQPLVPVLPVARELLSKTKFGPSKNHHGDPQKRKAKNPPKLLPFLNQTREANGNSSEKGSAVSLATSSKSTITNFPISAEPQELVNGNGMKTRQRVLSLFKRNQTSHTKGKGSVDSEASVESNASWATNGSLQSLPPRTDSLRQPRESTSSNGHSG
ncbi:golgi-body localization protein domain-containing protein [Abortiporus biennis]|nr:golgi-body localization protein domain-containing protein [Abortiporus biennis]